MQGGAIARMGALLFVQFAVASDSVQIQFKNIAADFIDEHQIRTHVAIAESL